VPQGSVLGPLEFEAYTEDLVEVMDKHDMKSHLYADEIQLYTSGQLKDIDVIRSRLSRCVSDVVAVEHREDGLHLVWIVCELEQTAGRSRLFSSERHWNDSAVGRHIQSRRSILLGALDEPARRQGSGNLF